MVNTVKKNYQTSDRQMMLNLGIIAVVVLSILALAVYSVAGSGGVSASALFSTVKVHNVIKWVGNDNFTCFSKNPSCMARPVQFCNPLLIGFDYPLDTIVRLEDKRFPDLSQIVIQNKTIEVDDNSGVCEVDERLVPDGRLSGKKINQSCIIGKRNVTTLSRTTQLVKGIIPFAASECLNFTFNVNPASREYGLAINVSGFYFEADPFLNDTRDEIPGINATIWRSIYDGSRSTGAIVFEGNVTTNLTTKSYVRDFDGDTAFPTSWVNGTGSTIFTGTTLRLNTTGANSFQMLGDSEFDFGIDTGCWGAEISGIFYETVNTGFIGWKATTTGAFCQVCNGVQVSVTDRFDLCTGSASCGTTQTFPMKTNQTIRLIACTAGGAGNLSLWNATDRMNTKTGLSTSGKFNFTIAASVAGFAQHINYIRFWNGSEFPTQLTNGTFWTLGSNVTAGTVQTFRYNMTAVNLSSSVRVNISCDRGATGTLQSLAASAAACATAGNNVTYGFVIDGTSGVVKNFTFDVNSTGAAVAAPGANPVSSVPIRQLPSGGVFITTPNITMQVFLNDSGNANIANITVRWFNTTSLINTTSIFNVVNLTSVNFSLPNTSYAFTNGLGNLTAEVFATAANGSNSTRFNSSFEFINNSLPYPVSGINAPSNGNETASPLFLTINASSDPDVQHTIRYFWFRNNTLIAETTDANLTVVYASGQFRRDLYNATANDTFSGPVAPSTIQNFLVNTMFPNPNQAGRNPGLVVYNSTIVNVSFILGLGANETNATVNLTVFRNGTVLQSTIQNSNNASNITIMPNFGPTKGDIITFQSILRDAYNTNASNFSSYTINNSLPTAPLCAFPNGTLSNVNVSLNITASSDNDSDAITYRTSVNTSVSLLLNGSSTNTNFSFVGAAGAYFYRFDSDDESGNITGPQVCTVQVKTAAPNITHLTIYSHAANAFTVNFSVNESYRLSGGSLGQICFGSVVSNLSTCTNLTSAADAGNRSIQVTGVSSGLTFVEVSVDDNVSNVANYSSPVNVSVQAAPGGSLNSGGGGGGFVPVKATDVVANTTTFRVLPGARPIKTSLVIYPGGDRNGSYTLTATEKVVACVDGSTLQCVFDPNTTQVFVVLQAQEGRGLYYTVTGTVRVQGVSGARDDVPFEISVIDLDGVIETGPLPFTIGENWFTRLFLHYNPDKIPIGVNILPTFGTAALLILLFVV